MLYSNKASYSNDKMYYDWYRVRLSDHAFILPQKLVHLISSNVMQAFAKFYRKVQSLEQAKLWQILHISDRPRTKSNGKAEWQSIDWLNIFSTTRLKEIYMLRSWSTYLTYYQYYSSYTKFWSLHLAGDLMSKGTIISDWLLEAVASQWPQEFGKAASCLEGNSLTISTANVESRDQWKIDSYSPERGIPSLCPQNLSKFYCVL